MFKVYNKDTKKRQIGCFDVLFYVALVFCFVLLALNILFAFVFFIVDFEQVNVCIDNCCCIAKSSKAYLKSSTKNEYFWFESK